jgi:small subunit ribosomal protein S3
MIEKDFVTEGLKRTRIDEYLEKELERAGYGGMEIQVTPLGTMVVVYAERPGMVIGRGGKTVRNITQNLKTGYGLENPQVEVKEVDIPELSPKIMAHKIAAMLQRGMHFRRVAYTALRRIMSAGAQGVEVTISGKIRGARSATAKFTDGYIKRCGEPSIKFVREGFATVQLKPGVLGVYVRIMPPGVILPDKVDIKDLKVEESSSDSVIDTLESEESVEIEEEDLDTEEDQITEEVAEDIEEKNSGLQVSEEPSKDKKINKNESEQEQSDKAIEGNKEKETVTEEKGDKSG